MARRRLRGSTRKHHALMSKFIQQMVVRRFEDPKEMAAYFVDALDNSRPIDDIYGELVVWAATKYESEGG